MFGYEDCQLSAIRNKRENFLSSLKDKEKMLILQQMENIPKEFL